MTRPLAIALVMLFAGLLIVSPTGPSAEAARPESASSGASKDLWTRAAPEIFPGCACAVDRSEILTYRDQIAAAPTASDARDLALDQTRLARKALSRAKWVLPFNSTVSDTIEKIEGFEARVIKADTQADVAREFSTFLRLPSAGSLKSVDPGVAMGLFGDDDEKCDYTTTEIIIIVIGLLFGIIPGLIFLLVFC